MKKAFVLLISAGIFFCNCAEYYENMFDLDTFDKEFAAWKALGITAYRFTAWAQIDPPTYPATVTVRPNAEPEVIFERPPENQWHAHNPFSPFEGVTIDELLASIRKLAVSTSMKKYYVTIQYNKEYRYPEYYDESIKEKGVVGAGFSFEITRFEVLGEGEE